MVSAKLAIGAAQFGMGYGATNRVGMVPRKQVEEIIGLYASAVPDPLIDTAPSYGESEAVVGQCVAKLRKACSIVTKTGGASASIRPILLASLNRLRLRSVYALIDHNAGNLLASHGDVTFREMERLKDEGKAQRIGASVYNAQQIEALMERYSLDLIQVPISLLDQRLLASGHLRQLKACGLEVHARSVFLQGVLLVPPHLRPPYLQRLDAVIEEVHTRAREAGVTPLQAALGFVLSQPDIDRVVVGVTSRAEFEEILTAAEPFVLATASRMAIQERQLLEPSQWPQ